MSKIDKKKLKLQERIQKMESDLKLALTKKDSNSVEINVPKVMCDIQDLKRALALLK